MKPVLLRVAAFEAVVFEGTHRLATFH